MLILNGNNLGERQKDFNTKVNEAVSNNVDFKTIVVMAEQSDIDKLFKIDLASKYKNIEYIIEVLKSGDSLHISRALKCAWMFEDEYSHMINVDYLHHNVFPLMSTKMKKKLLTTTSSYVRNVDRAISFCDYCINTKLTNIAQKFVCFTSDLYKINFIEKHHNLMSKISYNNNLQHFIGNSFTVADAYLSTRNGEYDKLQALSEMSYLYSVSNVKYLDLLEKQVPSLCPIPIHEDNWSSSGIIIWRHLGLRISKYIITKHRSRVLNNPSLYLCILNKSAISKHSTSENAKTYAITLLPNSIDKFWDDNFCGTFEYVLNILPAEERFSFIKRIFHDKYLDQPFEIDLQFHSHKYYRFMTSEQKDKWALEQIASQRELLGIGNDYKWYAFINFETAFDAIKKLVILTREKSKRSKMINVLVESAKTQRDLEKLFNYYYLRHNNERLDIKHAFVDKVGEKHNIFKFDKECWDAFNKIYQNLDVYSMTAVCKSRSKYKIIALIYHIINNINVHDSLKLYLKEDMCICILKYNTDKLSKVKQEMVYQYIHHFFMDIFNYLNSVPYEKEVKNDLRKYIVCFLDFLSYYGKNKQDIPEVVTKLMKLDWDQFEHHEIFRESTKEVSFRVVTQDDIIRLLKQDAKLVIENLPLVKENVNRYDFKIGKFLQKLRVYFTNDISKQYLKFFDEFLTGSSIDSRTAQAACFGIFQLAEDSYKVDFMAKHSPTQSKVNRSEIDENFLNIQEAICRTAFYSRPPVPLNTMLLYLKGDYVSSCRPMFNYYLANLPPTLCKEFIAAILNNPLSIRKHGLRLAFETFDVENLKKIVLDCWNKNKNVTFRRIIYKELFTKVTREDPEAQAALFETLRTLTLEIHQDDDEEVFELFTSRYLPKHFMSPYADAAWTAVNALPFNKLNLQRKIDVLKYMCSNIVRLHQNIRPIVEYFIKDEMKTEEVIKESLLDLHKSLTQTKWDVTANYLTYLQNEEDLENNLKLTELVISHCCGRVALVTKKRYNLQRFFTGFIRNLIDECFSRSMESYKYVSMFLDSILQMLNKSSTIEEIYMIVWAIKISIVTSRALTEIKGKLSYSDDEFQRRIKVKNGILGFGKNIGIVIEAFREKEIYFTSFLSDIQSEVIKNTQTVVNHINGLYEDDALVVTSLALMEFKTSTTYLFALNILPSNYNKQYVEDYKSVVNELKALNNQEVKCTFYRKFVHCNFEPWINQKKNK